MFELKVLRANESLDDIDNDAATQAESYLNAALARGWQNASLGWIPHYFDDFVVERYCGGETVLDQYEMRMSVPGVILVREIKGECEKQPVRPYIPAHPRAIRGVEGMLQRTFDRVRTLALRTVGTPAGFFDLAARTELCSIVNALVRTPGDGSVGKAGAACFAAATRQELVQVLSGYWSDCRFVSRRPAPRH